MRQTEKKHHTIQSLFVAALFGVFGLCCIIVLIFGTRIYQGIVKAGESNAQLRTSLSYVAEKVHQNDTSDSIRLGSIEETPALLLSDTYDGTDYTTYIYFWEGQLKEQTLRTGLTPLPKAGQAITELNDFRISQISDTLYCFTASTSSGKEMSIYVDSRSR